MGVRRLESGNRLVGVADRTSGDAVVSAGDLLPSWAAVAPGRLEALWDARGWPVRLMFCGFEKADGVTWTTTPARGGLAVFPSRPPSHPAGAGSDQRVLPLRFIWPGAAVNTVFYAALLWLLILAPRALRRSARLRRGSCLECGYPLGESMVCPECGAAPPKAAVPCARVGGGAALLVLLIGLAGCHPPGNQEAFERKVHEWVAIGMRVEDAEAVLEEQSFKRWEMVWEDPGGTTGNLVYGRSAMTACCMPVVQAWTVRMRIEDGRTTAVRATTGCVGP